MRGPPSRKRCLTPRRSPIPSSPTVPTKSRSSRVSTPGLLERAQNGEESGQPPGVVADARCEEGVAALAYGDVGALGEHGVEVTGDGQDSGIGAETPPQADHVAFLVGPHGVGAIVSKHLGEAPASRFLAEGRSGYLGDLEQVAHGADIAFVHEHESALHPGQSRQVRNIDLRLLGREHGCREGRGGTANDREDAEVTCAR